VVFYGSLILPLVLLIQEQGLTKSEWQSAAALTGIAMVVHAVAIWGLPRWGTHLRARALFGSLYVIVLGVVTVGLLSIHATFYLVLSGFFSQLFFALSPLLAIPAATVATVLLGIFTLQERAFPDLLAEPAFWLWVLGGICGSLIALWFNAIIDQSAERQAMIEELHRAQTALARVEREAGILQERQRLAREIHDTLAQGLISIIIHLEAADQAFESNAGSLQHHLEQARRTARTNLGEARRVVQDLRPEVLDTSTLPDAIRRVVAAWMESNGIEASTYVTGAVVPLPAETEVTLLRVVQEALANVTKHAHAHTANVTLSYMPDRVLLDVQDDGDGLQEASSVPLFSAGFGLQSMRERVANLSGSLLIESESGEGTTLVVQVPIAPSHSLSLAESETPAPLRP
jgi:signal transduction histidine kinase